MTNDSNKQQSDGDDSATSSKLLPMTLRGMSRSELQAERRVAASFASDPINRIRLPHRVRDAVRICDFIASMQ